MKLLLIIVAMLMAGAGALHAWHERTLFIKASLLSEAAKLSANPKLRVADYYAVNGVMPHDNATAGLPPQSLYGSSVERIEVTDRGALVVEFGAAATAGASASDAAHARSMIFTPTVTAANSRIIWRCSSASISASVLSKLEFPCHPMDLRDAEPTQAAATAT